MNRAAELGVACGVLAVGEFVGGVMVTGILQTFRDGDPAMSVVSLAVIGMLMIALPIWLRAMWRIK